jgi:hypothetical protein
MAPQGCAVSLNARDGSGVRDLYGQLDRIPTEASHIVVSAGGNDALGEAAFLEESAASVAEVMAKLADVREQFGARYHSMLDAVLDRSLPTAVCTIYFSASATADCGRCTCRVQRRDHARAFSRHTVLIDLRLICAVDDDFANPIESSVQRGEKIARAILAFAGGRAPRRGVIQS